MHACIHDTIRGMNERTRPSFAACRPARMHLSYGRLPRSTHQFLLFHPEAKNGRPFHLVGLVRVCVHATCREENTSVRRSRLPRVDSNGQWRPSRWNARGATVLRLLPRANNQPSFGYDGCIRSDYSFARSAWREWKWMRLKVMVDCWRRLEFGMFSEWRKSFWLGDSGRNACDRFL